MSNLKELQDLNDEGYGSLSKTNSTRKRLSIVSQVSTSSKEVKNQFYKNIVKRTQSLSCIGHNAVEPPEQVKRNKSISYGQQMAKKIVQKLKKMRSKNKNEKPILSQSQMHENGVVYWEERYIA